MKKLLFALFGLVSLITSLLLFATNASASESNGTIDADAKFAWSDTIGWLNFFAPEGNIHVTDTVVTGFAWNEGYGWIFLSPADAGVRNDGEGHLSGRAWGETVGYIDFSEVTIDANGFFHGVAHGDISGDIRLNCADFNSCASSDFRVRTDWRPLSVRSEDRGEITTDTGGGSSRLVTMKNLSVPEKIHGSGEEKIAGEKRPLTPDHWSSPYFSLLQSLTNAQDCPQTEIFPDENISRAEVVKMAVCSFGYPLPKDVPSSFPDVDSHYWGKAYIAAAEQNNIINGYGDGTFRPDKTISRAEALKIFCLAAKLSFPSRAKIQFSDIATSAWYVPIVSYAAEQQIVEGYSDGTFRPDQSVTSAEAAKLAVEAEERRNVIPK